MRMSRYIQREPCSRKLRLWVFLCFGIVLTLVSCHAAHGQSLPPLPGTPLHYVAIPKGGQLQTIKSSPVNSSLIVAPPVRTMTVAWNDIHADTYLIAFTNLNDAGKVLFYPAGTTSATFVCDQPQLFIRGAILK